ncbi:Uncharacterised protein [Metamycoplasma cloacale]|uniref:Uncharacterized protein n=1 Tax=Metamycoplasma cloacale TaxID=92401 RepID=A0A2Z4LLV7_9BACT|nr:hypothetical protein [Metamycoplasma cloacale]AWX42680.1 hypothetical protein DK849_01145 [Metamycoplasma cloacale]VEU79508.1 Uncharacterised protein [Metamycoplasma cloacale]
MNKNIHKFNLNTLIYSILSFGIFSFIEFILLFITINVLPLSQIYKIIILSFLTIVNLLIIIILLTCINEKRFPIIEYKKINKNSVSALNYYINTIKSNNENYTNIYTDITDEIWQKKCNYNISSKRTWQLNLVNILLVCWFAWIQTIILLTIYISLLLAPLKHTSSLKEPIFIIGISSTVFYLISALITTTIFFVKIKNRKLTITNYNLLNNNVNTDELEKYILLNAISYLPQTKHQLCAKINFTNTVKSSIALNVLTFADPKIIFDINLYKINENFSNSKNPIVTITNPTNELIIKLENSGLYLIKNNDEIQITFNKNHVEYPKLFKIIYNEYNLNISTNDKYFSQFYSIVLKEIYKSSLEEKKCNISIKNQLQWQTQNYFNKIVLKSKNITGCDKQN